MLFEQSESPRFCWSALPRMLMKTVADFRSPATSTSLTVTRPASPTGEFLADRLADGALQQFATRWIRREGMYLDVNR